MIIYLLFVHSETHHVLTYKTHLHNCHFIFFIAFVEPPKTKKIPTGAVSIFPGKH